jgi:oligopeptide transport system substrate-binding protein
VVPIDLATGPTGNDFRTDAGTYPGYNPAEAQQAWELAKQELGIDSLDLVVILDNTDYSIKVAQALQADISANLPGLTITLEQMPQKTRIERQGTGDYDLGMSRWGADYSDPMTFLDRWISERSNNYWGNSEYDAIIASAQKGELTKDPSARWTKLIEAEKMMMDDQAIIPLYQPGRALMVRTGVAGIIFNSAGVGRIYTHASKSD